MHKLTHVFLSALLALPLISCHDNTGRELSEIRNADAADSVAYLFGRMKAHEYWQYATSDTVYRHRDQIDSYLEGVEDALHAVRDNDPAYNAGRRMGLRLANIMETMKVRYNLDIDKEMVLDGFQYGLRDDYDQDELQVQQDFYEILDRFKTKKEVSDRKEALEAIRKEATLGHYSKISDNLYCRLQKPGEGPKAKRGQQIYAAVDYARINGDDIGIPSPDQMVVGSKGMPEVLITAFCQLSKGGRATFLTSALALFGRRADVMNLEPADPVVVTITLNDIVTEGNGLDSNKLPVIH